MKMKTFLFVCGIFVFLSCQIRLEILIDGTSCIIVNGSGISVNPD